MKKRDYAFEIYLNNPVTKQNGWEIEYIEIMAETYPEALKEIKKVDNFDVIITDYHRPSFISETDFLNLWSKK
jgi:CheY-like chemotaxis protein